MSTNMDLSLYLYIVISRCQWILTPMVYDVTESFRAFVLDISFLELEVKEGGFGAE